MPARQNYKKSDPYTGPEIRLDDDGQLRFYFDGLAAPIVVCAPMVEMSRDSFGTWFYGEPCEKIDAAWMAWTTLLHSEVGKALRWWGSTEFLRDGININVRMG